MMFHCGCCRCLCLVRRGHCLCVVVRCCPFVVAVAVWVVVVVVVVVAGRGLCTHRRGSRRGRLDGHR